MATAKKFTLFGEQVGEVELDERLVNAEANTQSIKDYIVALRNNQRQWSASTKTRAEVKHTTAKTHAQKGTGRARHGARSAPQYRGGGVVFGPKPKFDQHVKINKKEKRAAIRSLIGEKCRSGSLFIVDSLKMKNPKTKTVSDFIQKNTKRRRVLFIGEASFAKFETEGNEKQVSVVDHKHEAFQKSIRNLARVEFCTAPNMNGYHTAVADEIFLTEEALKQIVEWLC